MEEAQKEEKQSAISPESGGISSQKIFFIEGIRGFGAIWIVLHHMFIQRKIGLIEWPLLKYGTYGVDIFIIVSGFGLMLSAIECDYSLAGGLWSFVKKRAKRFVFPYYGGLLFSLVLIWLLIGTKTGTHWDTSLFVTWKGFLYHVLFLQSIMHYPSQINHTYWYIAFQFELYILFPILLFFCKKFGTMISIATVSILAISFHFSEFHGDNDYRILLFLIGIVAAELYKSKRAMWQFVHKKIPWKLLFWILLVWLIYGTFNEYWNIYYRNIIVGFITFSGILYLSKQTSKDILQRFFESKRMLHLGKISYSIYLIHAPVIEVLSRYIFYPMKLGYNVTFILYALFGLPIVIIVADIFYRIFEKSDLFVNIKNWISPRAAFAKTVILNKVKKPTDRVS